MQELFKEWVEQQHIVVQVVMLLLVLTLCGLIVGYIIYSTYVIATLLYYTGHWFILTVYGIGVLSQVIKLFSKGDN